MKPPFAYYGGKTRIAQRIVATFPTHDAYLEPFAGGLSVLLAKEPAKIETVNDIWGNLVTFWRVLRDQPDDLARVANLTPHSRQEQSDSFDLVPELDDLEAARRVWVQLSQSRAASGRKSGWRYFSNPNGTNSPMTAYLAAYGDRIAKAAERLLNVSIECRPAVDVIEDYGKHSDTLIYADPPYLLSARNGGSNYKNEMTSEQDHRDLADALLGARGPVVLSGYHSPLYDDLYASWYVVAEIAASADSATTKTGRTEVLWSNRDLAAADLFTEEVPA